MGKASVEGHQCRAGGARRKVLLLFKGGVVLIQREISSQGGPMRGKEVDGEKKKPNTSSEENPYSYAIARLKDISRKEEKGSIARKKCAFLTLQKRGKTAPGENVEEKS